MVFSAKSSTPYPLIAPADVDLAVAAGECVVQTHRRLVEFLRVGQTLAQIDTFVAQTLEDLGARSCFLGYSVGRSPKFTGHACLSVNHCVVHGRPGDHTTPMRAGDVLKIDIGVWKNGFIGDAAWTYVFKHYPDEATRRLMDVGKDALRRGVQELRPGQTLLAWARAVQTCVETDARLHLVRGLGGHGYGRKLHQAPFVSNVVPAFPQEWPEGQLPCLPGLLVAVEPMLAIGTGRVVQHGREWPVFSADGSMTAHYEHDVLVTPEGPRVLTAGLESLPDLVG